MELLHPWLPADEATKSIFDDTTTFHRKNKLDILKAKKERKKD